MKVRDLQLYELDILKEFARVCNENHLKYYLAYGTLLGAIRHKGFIPWDDDIDVYMPIDDYKMLEEACKKSLTDKYYFQSRDVNCQNFIAWNRIGVKNSTSIDRSLANIHMQWGIGIDIFPLFPYSSSIKIQEKRNKWYRKYNLLSLKYYHIKTMKNASGLEKIKKAMHKCIPDSLNLKLCHYYMNKLSTLCDTSDEYVTDYVIEQSDKAMKKEWFGEGIQLPFEDSYFNVPVNYDKVLTAMYGEYKHIPEETGKINHSDNPNVYISFNEPYEKFWE